MRYIIAIVLVIHGLIHLMGFAKAFFETEMSKQVLGISKPIGSIWLITFILFMVSATQFLNHKKWFYLAFITVLLSQVLIIIAWQNAKFGSIFNLIILIVSLSAFGNHLFNKMVQNEANALLHYIENRNGSVIIKKDIKHLPEIVQKWMENSLAIGEEKVQTVRLKQIGNMRTKANGKWMPFKANQYINVNNPSFVWTTKVDAMPLIYMDGRDKLVDGEGEMLIKLASLVTIVNEGKNLKTNSGAMLRYLGEICWFPQAGINDYVTWEAIDKTSARATLSIQNKSVSGIFKFNEKGEQLSFEANRYYGGKSDSKLEKWVIKIKSYKLFNGIKIPYKCEVIWRLEDGDFNWLNFEIVDIEYNIKTTYK